MPGTPTLPRRDTIAILAAIAGTAAIAWIYLAMLAIEMGDLKMSGMVMESEHAMQIRPWSSGDFGMMFAMWAIMMVGMMLPTAIPMTLMYAAIARKAEKQGAPIAPTFNFVLGYVVTWTAFSMVATFLQWGFDQAALLSPMMIFTSPWTGALVLVLAGVYQMTPAKESCLAHCRAPAHFISQNWRPGSLGAFRLGNHHGAWCLGCCWALMLMLFVGGVMNLLWIAAITGFVLAEKILPLGAASSRWTGCAMIMAGGVFALRWIQT